MPNHFPDDEYISFAELGAISFSDFYGDKQGDGLIFGGGGH